MPEGACISLKGNLEQKPLHYKETNMEKSPFCIDELEIFVIFCQFSHNLLCLLGIKIKLLWQWIVILLLHWYVLLMLVVMQWVSWHTAILRQNIIKFMIFKKYLGIAYFS